MWNNRLSKNKPIKNKLVSMNKVMITGVQIHQAITMIENLLVQ